MSNTCPHCGGEIDDWGDSLIHILKHRKQIVGNAPSRTENQSEDN